MSSEGSGGFSILGTGGQSEHRATHLPPGDQVPGKVRAAWDHQPQSGQARARLELQVKETSGRWLDGGRVGRGAGMGVGLGVRAQLCSREP